VFKLFFAIAGLLVLAALAFGAGLVYLGYRAKQKVEAIQHAYQHDDQAGTSGAATRKTSSFPPLPDSAEKKVEEIQQAYKHDDLAGIVGAVTGESSKPQPLPDWKPAPAELLSSPASKIPLRKSLRLVEVGTEELRGDYESIFIVDSVTDQTVHISGAQQFPAGQGIERILGGASNKPRGPRKIECGRTILRSDLVNSAEADGYFCREGKQERHPGSTAMGLSKHTLNELKTAGHSDITFHEDPLKALFKSFKNAMASGSDSSSDAASTDLMKKMMNFAPGGGGDSMDTPPIKCTLQRVGATDLAFPILVNDQPVELPVINVAIKVPDSDIENHAYILDDPENPLMLAVATKTSHGQFVKIYWDAEKKPASQLAEQLEKNGRAKVYDLYCDFRSDGLRPESKKVLDEIAQVMRQHPDWKLGVEGHTDNVGGDAFNLDLSKRRAAAVKQALVTQYNVASGRLSSSGSGASSPVDRNDTLEGRARNRRVELVRN
jgi:outer membrane protein OmpA-like peptidoglycan-associated protein